MTDEEMWEFLTSRPDDKLLLRYDCRVHHQWSKRKRRRKKERIGTMPVLQIKTEFLKQIQRGYTDDVFTLNGAN